MRTSSVYDGLNSLLFFPTGSLSLRRQFVREMSIRGGDRVLELGCGTGQVTRALLDAGAEVVAVDRLSGMLERARTRALGARFVEADIMAFDSAFDFDATVLAFVLHNFDQPGRREILKRARERTSEAGMVAVLEWASPRGAMAPVWRSVVSRIEPSASAAEVLDGALADDIGQVGMSIVKHRRLANGRAAVWLAR